MKRPLALLFRGLLSIMLLHAFSSQNARAANKEPEIAVINGNKAVANCLLVKVKCQNLKNGKTISGKQRLAKDGLRVMRTFKSNKSLFSVSIAAEALKKNAGKKVLTEKEKGDALLAKIKKLMATGEYEYVEPDWIVSLEGQPQKNEN